MPTVPTSFVPQVAPAQGGDIGQFQAPGVQPMENLFPQQQVALGRAMVQAGEVAFRAGSAMQDDLDNANAKSGDVEGLKAANPIFQNYMAAQGKDAEDGYAAAVDGVRSAFQAQIDRMPTETSKAMYQQVAARNIAQFESQMNAHRMKEARVYAKNESVARRDVRVQMAVNSVRQADEVNPMTGKKFGMAEMDVNLAVAVNEQREAMRLEGISQDSAQWKLGEQQVYESALDGMTNALLADGKYAEAQQLIDRFADGRVGEKALKAMNQSLEANRQVALVEQLADSIRRDGYAHAAADPKQYPERDGTDVPPEDLRGALDRANMIEDPKMRRLVRDKIKSDYDAEEALLNVEYRNNYDAVAQYLAVPGNRLADLSPKQKAMLTPAHLSHFQAQEFGEADARADYEVALNPSRVLDAGWMQQQMGAISPAKYAEYVKAAREPQKIIDSTLDEDQVKQTLVDAGLRDIAYPNRRDEDEVDTGLRFRENVTSMVEAEQRRLNRKLSRDEKQSIIDRAIVQQATIRKPGMIYGYNEITKPMATMTPEEMSMKFERFVQMEDIKIPQDEYVRAINALEGVGIAVPTNRQIKAYIMRSRAK
jgi:hypothetical protein